MIVRMTAACGLALTLLSGCTVAKVAGKAVTLPAKAVWTTGKVATKGVWYTGKGTYYAGKYAGAGLWYVGTAPVKITDAALDSSIKMLTITTQVIDLSGTLLTFSQTVPASALDNELRLLDSSIRAMTSIRRVVSVIVDVASLS